MVPLYPFVFNCAFPTKDATAVFVDSRFPKSEIWMSPSGSPPCVRVKVTLCVISGDSNCPARVVERREVRGRRVRKRIVECGVRVVGGEMRSGGRKGERKEEEKGKGKVGRGDGVESARRMGILYRTSRPRRLGGTHGSFRMECKGVGQSPF